MKYFDITAEWRAWVGSDVVYNPVSGTSTRLEFKKQPTLRSDLSDKLRKPKYLTKKFYNKLSKNL